MDNAIVATNDWPRAGALSARPPIEWLEKRLQSYIAQCCPDAARFGGYYLYPLASGAFPGPGFPERSYRA